MRLWQNLCIVLVASATVLVGQAQVNLADEFKVGELLVRLQPGQTIDKARALAARLDAEVRPIAVPDMYVFRLKSSATLTPSKWEQMVFQLTEQLERDPAVRTAEPHWRKRLFQVIPNDPLVPQQWALEQIRAFGGWEVERGQPDIRLAIIDDNFLRSHPDLQSRFDPLSRNFVADPPNQSLDPEAGATLSHGTDVMGVAAAATNNGIGIAGLCWEGVSVVALKTTAAVTEEEFFLDGENILEAYQYVIENASQIHVVNMSYGGYFRSRTEENFIREMYRRGLVLVASAGNFSLRLPSYPSSFPEVVRVSATGPTGEPATYTDYTNVTVAAPGGDTRAFGERGAVLTTGVIPRGNLFEPAYVPTEGTSFAAPYVAAAAALLLSAGVPRHSPEDPEPLAVQLLKDTADPRGRAVPDDYLGRGIINVEEALRSVSGAIITIEQPAPGFVSDSRTVRVRLTVRRVRNDALDNIRSIRLNGQPIQRSVWTEKATFEARRRTFFIDFTLDVPAEGSYEITVEAEGDNGEVRSDAIRFLVRAKTFPAGLQMIAIPYAVDRLPEEVFGADAVLARYLPEAGEYARYTSTNRDPRAGFTPPNVNVRPQGEDTPTPPRGIGYFLLSRSDVSLLPVGLVDTGRAYLIPLQPGWNMVGNPFPFNVPWGACEVEILGEGGQIRRLSLEEAVDREIIRPQIYRYLPLSGSYTWRTAPLGELLAWQAHWVRALKPCTLVVPPIGSLRSAGETSLSIDSARGWRLNLIVRTSDGAEQHLLIGVAPRARDDADQYDVERPPEFAPRLTTQLTHSATRRALIQDMRGSDRRTQQWLVEVRTPTPDTEVVLQWNAGRSVPRHMRLTLVDPVSNTRINMLQRSSYQFRVGAEGIRRLRIEAIPARGARLRILNAVATPTRSGEFAIQYALSESATVSLTVRDAAGRVVRQLSARTRSSGANTEIWNGRTDSGVAVPPGTYQVHIVAVGDDGETARLALPIVLTR